MWMMAVVYRLWLSAPIFLLNCLYVSYGSDIPELSLKMQVLPAVFGQKFTMWCEIKNRKTICNDLRQWYGGRHYRLLCEDGRCLEGNKYTESMLQDCSYMLIISNLSENDLDCYYGCQYGFNQVRKELILDESKFRYFPTNNDIDTVLTTTEEKLVKLKLNVKKVFPKPRCHMNITETDQIVLQEVKKQGTFYQMSLNVTIPQRLLLGCKVMVVCEIGERNVTIVDKKLLECNSEDSEDGATYIVVAVVVAVFFVVLTCVILIYIFRCRKGRNMQKISETTLIENVETSHINDNKPVSTTTKEEVCLINLTSIPHCNANDSMMVDPYTIDAVEATVMDTANQLEASPVQFQSTTHIQKTDKI